MPDRDGNLTDQEWEEEAALHREWREYEPLSPEQAELDEQIAHAFAGATDEASIGLGEIDGGGE